VVILFPYGVALVNQNSSKILPRLPAFPAQGRFKLPLFFRVSPRTKGLPSVLSEKTLCSSPSHLRPSCVDYPPVICQFVLFFPGTGLPLFTCLFSPDFQPFLRKPPVGKTPIPPPTKISILHGVPPLPDPALNTVPPVHVRPIF